MIRLLAKAWALIFAGMAVWFGWLFAVVYWSNRACFDENGRCLVDGVVHHDSTFVYFWIVLLSLVSALAGAVCDSRLRRPDS
ncbi:hypothetical protein [uncultured Maricaulis sp.]|uniref:hypothetical protein n=1 Tax=uncultured Maricaulis sp. TaxID=174710 RepID=UPI0026145F1D|nr:hypothetical protein [uncultured Maricaulis sp.]